jgi:predicted anti-sigma-YlaC factor YlaD
MYLEAFRKWIRQIYATRDEELDCEACFDAIPKYVDMEIAGEKTNPHFSEVEQHLNQCPHCHDLYLTLRDAALLERRVEMLEGQQVEPVELLERLEVEPMKSQRVALLENQQAAQQVTSKSATV